MLTLSRAVRNKNWIIATWSITTLLCSAAYTWGGDGPANQEIQVGHQGVILESDGLVAGHEDQFEVALQTEIPHVALDKRHRRIDG